MSERQRFRLYFRGQVQGVGCRPALARLAQQLGLGGELYNHGPAVQLELEGPLGFLPAFLERLPTALPALSGELWPEMEPLPLKGQLGLSILPSREAEGLPQLLPDIAPCAACLAEVFSPSGRRARYVFTSCTACGPRYSIQRAVPWDREHTTLSSFALCIECLQEYQCVEDRRFHAQTLACPACGPQLEGVWPSGERQGRGESALQQALECLRRGQILALLGVGGFQLLVDAQSEQAVQRLRQRKGRPHKPLAVLVTGQAEAERLAMLSPLEWKILSGPETPIVLLRAREPQLLAESVAQGLPWLGLMLPASPLHALLGRDFGKPLVLTSGNRSGEPLCLTLSDALQALSGCADFFLSHDRPLLRPLDDSVVQVVAGQAGREQVQWLRRGRGATPLRLVLPECLTPRPHPTGTWLGLGGQLKVAPALLHARDATPVELRLGPYIGDLTTEKALQRQLEGVQSLVALHRVAPEGVLMDAHPQAATVPTVQALGLPASACWHHEAHARAAMLEAQVSEALALVWDGAGYGEDGTLWGGELLHLQGAAVWRRGQLRPFGLVGGEAAFRQPWRCLVGVWCEELPLSALPTCVRVRLPALADAVEKLLHRRLQRVETSSGGRLFDAVAALLGFEGAQTYEGQAALWLEGLASRAYARERAELEGGNTHELSGSRPLELPRVQGGSHGGGWLDPIPLLLGMARQLEHVTTPEQAERLRAGLALAFHRGLAEGLGEQVEGAQRGLMGQHDLPEVREKGLPVLLTGGCFQNRLLLRLTRGVLERRGWRVEVPEQLPPNDGGLAVGQLLSQLARVQEPQGERRPLPIEQES